MTLIGKTPEEAADVLKPLGWQAWWRGCDQGVPIGSYTAILKLDAAGQVISIKSSYPHLELPNLHG